MWKSHNLYLYQTQYKEEDFKDMNINKHADVPLYETDLLQFLFSSYHSLEFIQDLGFAALQCVVRFLQVLYLTYRFLEFFLALSSAENHSNNSYRECIGFAFKISLKQCASYIDI